MTRATLTKLLVLVILALIICLPDFFTLYRASKVKLLCMPYPSCGQENQARMEENGNVGVAEIRRGDMCHPSQTPQCEKWEQVCTQENQSKMNDPASDSRRGSEDPEKSWFMCQTDMDMAELQRNLSSSDLNEHLEVSLELQLRGADTLNLTLYGLNHHNFLDLHLPEEEEVEEGEDEGKKRDDERRSEAFFCCLSALPTSVSAGQSCCLLRIANQTVLAAIAKEKLPWKWTLTDEWRCVFRVLWLVLLGVVLLTIVTTVLLKIYWGRYKKPRVHRVGSDFSSHHLNDGEKHTDIFPKGMVLHSNGSELSPIPEVDSQDDIETLLDGNTDQFYTANLHHRSHHMTPPSQRSRLGSRAPVRGQTSTETNLMESTLEKNKNDPPPKKPI